MVSLTQCSYFTDGAQRWGRLAPVSQQGWAELGPDLSSPIPFQNSSPPLQAWILERARKEWGVGARTEGWMGLMRTHDSSTGPSPAAQSGSNLRSGTHTLMAPPEALLLPYQFVFNHVCWTIPKCLMIF